MRDLTAIGLTLMNRMVDIASANKGGAQLCTFRLITVGAYDPEAGTTVGNKVDLYPRRAFIDRADDKETKTGGQDSDSVRLVLAVDQLPRLPETQDEVLIGTRLWKVTGAQVDDMGVQLYVSIVVS